MREYQILDADWKYQKQGPVTPSYRAPIITGSLAPMAPRPAPVLPTAAALEGVDVRTAADRLRAYCDALDRRVERLERKARRPSRVRRSLRIRWRGARRRERKPDRRVEQLERGLLDAGYRLSLAEHRIAYLEDAEVRA